MSSTKTVPVRKVRRLGQAANPVSEPARLSVVAPSADPGLRTLARLIRVEPGLHVLSVGAIGGSSKAVEGIALPAIQITSPPSDQFDPVEIVTAWADAGAWLGQDGGVVVLRSPPGGGHVLLTAYAEPGGVPAFPEDIEVRLLDRPAPVRTPAWDNVVPVAKPAPPAEPVEADITITMHIERQGDRSFPAKGWVGNLGRRVRIEAFSILPQSLLSPDDIEYKAFGPQGRETQWTSGGKLCGTRGRGLPLTGFAVQPVARLRDQFDIIYQGSFFDSGITKPCHNGEPCLPARVDDVLEAINLRVVERDGS